MFNPANKKNKVDFNFRFGWAALGGINYILSKDSGYVKNFTTGQTIKSLSILKNRTILIYTNKHV